MGFISYMPVRVIPLILGGNYNEEALFTIWAIDFTGRSNFVLPADPAEQDGRRV